MPDDNTRTEARPKTFSQAFSHVHWLENGFVEIWLLLRMLERSWLRAATQHAHDVAEDITRLQRLVGTHLEECAAIDDIHEEDLVAKLLSASIAESPARHDTPHNLRNFLLRERRRLLRRGQQGTSLNNI